MKISQLLALWAAFYCSTAFSQTISGTVVSDSGAVSGARVQLLGAGKLLSYQFTKPDGAFSFHGISADSLELRASHLNFEPATVSIGRIPASDIVIVLDQKVNMLEEVRISTNLPIRQRNDTVVYNPSEFKDGTERVVEDLLKKLPGVNVSEEGKIYFEGKEIQALMLDGDDLFRSKYTVGSKNLDVDAVESVEAIRNHNANKVLHQLTESNQVALNLKLKKNLAEFSMRADLQNDFREKYNNSANALILASKIKGFAVAGIDNVGYREEGEAGFTELYKNFKTHRLPRIISEGAFPFVTGGRAHLNNSIESSGSAKVSFSRTSVTASASMFKDRAWQDLKSSTRYLLQDGLTVNNSVRQVKRPLSVATSAHLNYYDDDNLQIDIYLDADSRHSDFESNAVISGAERKSMGESLTNQFRVLGSLTRKLGEASAIEARVSAFSIRNDEQLSVFPAVDAGGSQVSRQDVDLRADFAMADIQYYKNWNRIKLRLTNLFEHNTGAFNSHLQASEGSPDLYLNDFSARHIVNQLSAHATYATGRFKYVFNPVFWYNSISSHNDEDQVTDVLLNGAVRYIPVKKHAIAFTFSEDYSVPGLHLLYRQPVLTSYSSLSSNQGKPDAVKSSHVMLEYSINDYYNTFVFRTAINYQYKDKDYYYQFNASEFLLETQTLLRDLSNTRTSWNVSADKLIPLIRINARINSSVAWSSYYTLGADQSAWEISGRSWTGDVTLSKKLGRFTLQDQFWYNTSSYSGPGFSHSASLWRNEAKIIYTHSNRFSAWAGLHSLQPDTGDSRRYSFLDFEMSYKFRTADMELFLKGQNLLNENTFGRRSVSEIAVYHHAHNLQERALLLGMRFKVF